jgi:hypothetical protein
MLIKKGRHSGRVEGDFVLFLIGMRINKLLHIHRWLPTLLAMPRLVKELRRRPELGLLHAELFMSGRTIQMQQYWRSFEHLHSFAHAMPHLAAWVGFNRRWQGNSAVGIYHETYLIAAGEYECIYIDMPLRGLQRAGEAVPITDRIDNARQRIALESSRQG